MKRTLLPLALLVIFLLPTLSQAAPKNGCAPVIRALVDNANVTIKGTGELDILVVTDPLCWHCRLGHKLLGEYPELYHSVKLSFFPRQSFIGSDMAAWILEDNADSANIKDLVDWAYKDLKQPKTEDLVEARMIVLYQFVEAFPALKGTLSLDELYLRLEKDNKQQVDRSAELANAAELPGTPILIAGESMLLGYGPGAWIKALGKKAVCP